MPRRETIDFMNMTDAEFREHLRDEYHRDRLTRQQSQTIQNSITRMAGEPASNRMATTVANIPRESMEDKEKAGNNMVTGLLTAIIADLQAIKSALNISDK